MSARSYCVNCDQVQPYRLEDGTGFWECKVCGCPIECVECGQTMHAHHLVPDGAKPTLLVCELNADARGQS